ncbi:MAG: hypothetical protein R2860_08190 [Desulfobacterales bacterium]
MDEYRCNNLQEELTGSFWATATFFVSTTGDHCGFRRKQCGPFIVLKKNYKGSRIFGWSRITGLQKGCAAANELIRFNRHQVDKECFQKAARCIDIRNFYSDERSRLGGRKIHA